MDITVYGSSATGTLEIDVSVTDWCRLLQGGAHYLYHPYQTSLHRELKVKATRREGNISFRRHESTVITNEKGLDSAFDYCHALHEHAMSSGKCTNKVMNLRR